MEDCHPSPIGDSNTVATNALIAAPNEDVQALSGQVPGTPAVTARVEVTPAGEALSTPLSVWSICGDTVIGLAHRRNGLPCQDAVGFRNTPRPVLALSDGAGSAAVSELGAQALVTGIIRFLHTLEDDLASWLDDDKDTSQTTPACWANRLRLHAHGLLTDLARALRRDVRDLRATLQVAVVGKRRVFWWKVGDGAIVVKNANGMLALGNQASAKGEFANQTCFVDTVNAKDIQFGVLTAPYVSGIALMSDGGAEKLVSHNGARVANRLSEWLDAVAEQRFTTDKIALAFHEQAMWERTSLDDRAIVLCARTLSA